MWPPGRAGLVRNSSPRPRAAALNSPLWSSGAQDEEGKRRRLSTDDLRGGAAPPPPGASDDGCCSSGTAAGQDRCAGAPSASTSSSGAGGGAAAHDPQPMTQAVESMLRQYLLRWGQRLVQLQPKVRSCPLRCLHGPSCSSTRPACACARPEGLADHFGTEQCPPASCSQSCIHSPPPRPVPSPPPPPAPPPRST